MYTCKNKTFFSTFIYNIKLRNTVLQWFCCSVMDRYESSSAAVNKDLEDMNSWRMHDLLLIPFHVRSDPAVYTSIMLIFGQILRAYACLSKGSLYAGPGFAQGDHKVRLSFCWSCFWSHIGYSLSPISLWSLSCWYFPVVNYQSSKLDKICPCLSNVTFLFLFFFVNILCCRKVWIWSPDLAGLWSQLQEHLSVYFPNWAHQNLERWSQS